MKEIHLTPKQTLAYYKLIDKQTTEIGYGGGAGGGKILANDGIILTPFGWKKGGDLNIGDLINNPDGSIQKIIQISPEITLPLWRVFFSDNTFTDIAEDHLWLAWKGRDSRKIMNKEVSGELSSEVVETKTLKLWVERGYKPQIPVCDNQPFNKITKERDRIDPYLLGVLLGDGCITKGNLNITCAESDKEHYRAIFGSEDISYQSKKTIRFNGLKKKAIIKKLKLHKLEGTRSNTKFIPEAYKLSSIPDRYALVRGLMDTDGYKPKGKYSAYYYTISKRLAEDMAFVLRSLGAVVTITSRIPKFTYKGKKKEGQLAYNLHIKHREPDKIFSMVRKKNDLIPKKISKAVIKVEETMEFITGRCITVSNPNGLYITNDFIVTHNSFLGCIWVLTQALKYSKTSWLIGRRELSNLKKTTLLSLFKVLDVLELNPEDIFTLNNQTNIIYFKNESKIFLMDMSAQPSDPLYTRFGGLELTGAFIDESNESEVQAIEIIKTRIGRSMNKEHNLIPKLLETFNPAKNHVYTRYYRLYKDKKLPAFRCFITALATDNPYLSLDYIEQLKKADKITKERLLFGNFEYDDDPTKIFNYDSIIDMFTNEPVKGERYLTIDVAGRGRDKTVLICWEGLNAEKIVILNNISSEELNAFLINNQISRSRCLIDEDGVGFGLVNDMKGVKGFVNNAQPIRNKFEAQKKFNNYRNLKAQCWFLLAEYVNTGKIGIKDVSEEVKHLIIEDLEQIKQESPGRDVPLGIISKDEVKKLIGRSTDIGDALMMRMYFELFPKIGEIPIFGAGRV